MQMWLRTKVGEGQNELKNTAEMCKNVIQGREKKEFHMPREQEYERTVSWWKKRYGFVCNRSYKEECNRRVLNQKHVN